MRRYWVEKESLSEDEVVFRDETYHHIINVCRMKVGSKFEVILEGGQAYLVEMVEVGKKVARSKIIEGRQIEPVPRPYLNLALCVPRFSVLESVIEKCVELGVRKLALLFSDYSFVRSQDKISPSKQERWKKILISSTQQSGRGDLMELLSPVEMKKVVEEINQNPLAHGLFAYEGKGGQELKKALAQDSVRKAEEVWTFVGGEGGFSDDEVRFFKEKGLEPLTLGSQVLRVETACTTLISIIKYDLDLMR